MNKKILILLLLGQALPALAGSGLSLKRDDLLGLAAVTPPPSRPVARIAPAVEKKTAPPMRHTASFQLKLSGDLTDVSRVRKTRNAEFVDMQRALPVQTAGNTPSLKLKLAGATLDVSRIGTISATERASLLASGTALHADGAAAGVQSLPSQPEQTPVEAAPKPSVPGALAATASAPQPSTTVAAASAAQPVPALAVAKVQESHPKHLYAVAPQVAQQDDLELQTWTFATVGLLLAILSSWLGLRAYAGIMARIKRAEPQQCAAPVVKTPVMKIAIAKEEKEVAKEAVVKPADQVASIPRTAPLPPPPTPAPSPVVRTAAPASLPSSQPKVMPRLAGSAQSRPEALSKPEQRSSAPASMSQEHSVKNVVRKAVPLAQPRLALPQPQSSHPETKSGALSFLPGLGNFLADFDPTRTGGASEFLALRNAITTEQLIGWSTYRPASRNFALRVVGAPALHT